MADPSRRVRSARRTACVALVAVGFAACSQVNQEAGAPDRPGGADGDVSAESTPDSPTLDGAGEASFPDVAPPDSSVSDGDADVSAPDSATDAGVDAGSGTCPSPGSAAQAPCPVGMPGCWATASFWPRQQQCLVCGTKCVDEYWDTGNCGACGIVCAAGESCVMGRCGPPPPSGTILSGLGTPEDIAVDAQNIYYTDTGTSEVWQVDKRTFATTLLASAQARPFRLAVEGGYVYWSNADGGAIVRAPVGGFAAPAVIYAAAAPLAIAVDADAIYWSDGKKIYKGAKDPAVGGPPVLLADLAAVFPTNDPPTEFKIDGTRIYSEGCRGGVGGSVGVGAYGIDKTTGAIKGYEGCPFMYWGWGIAVSSAGVFWYKPLNGTTRQIKSTAGAMTLCSSISTIAPCVIPRYLAADECAVYFTDQQGRLWRLLPTEMAPRALATGGIRLALDETYVYTTGVGRIGRALKR
jgi:hypothetical protein